jgi:uncharacterized protein
MSQKTITVSVKPNSSQVRVEEVSDLVYKVWLNSSPVKGRANIELIKVMAKFFGISKNQIEIRSGKTSRIKILKVLID